MGQKKNMDLVIGSKIKIEEAYFSGKYPDRKFEGKRVFEAIIVKASYSPKLVLWFTLDVVSSRHDSIEQGKKIKRKAKTLYRNVTGFKDGDKHSQAKRHLTETRHTAVAKYNEAQAKSAA